MTRSFAFERGRRLMPQGPSVSPADFVAPYHLDRTDVDANLCQGLLCFLQRSCMRSTRSDEPMHTRGAALGHVEASRPLQGSVIGKVLESAVHGVVKHSVTSRQIAFHVPFSAAPTIECRASSDFSWSRQQHHAKPAHVCLRSLVSGRSCYHAQVGG